jgi:uncharacterized protein YjbI with pentapeptide repeats
MIKRSNFYQTSVISPDNSQNEDDLRRRWGKDRTKAIKHAIINNVDLPRIFPQIEVEYAGKIIKLEDLRGIDLSGTEIGEYDLAYCALDFSNMEDCVFKGTHFQYSRLIKASLKRTKLFNVQASPIDGRYLDFSKSTLTECFMSNSDLSQTRFLDAIMERCDLTESRITERAGKNRRKFVRSPSANPLTRMTNFLLVQVGNSMAKKAREGFVPVQVNQTHIGTVVALKENKIEVEVVTVSKKKLRDKSPAKPRVFRVYRNTDKVELGEIVQISNVKLEATVGKGKRPRAAGISGPRSQEHRQKNKWVISSS